MYQQVSTENVELLGFENPHLETQLPSQATNSSVSLLNDSIPAEQEAEEWVDKNKPLRNFGESVNITKNDGSTSGSARSTSPGPLESPKVVCSNSKLLIIRHFALYHLPAIAVTFTLLSLYIAKAQWDNPTPEQLNALQFAAKAHETLLLMSLTEIILHKVRYSLLYQKSGLSLGFIASAFYVGSPIQYLVSQELWGATFYCKANRRAHWLTGTMIILTAMICIAVSPLSAIAMIPRQDWWTDKDGWNAFFFQRDYVRGRLYETNFSSDHIINTTSAWSPRSTWPPSQTAMLQNLGDTLWGGAPTVPIIDGEVQFANITYANYYTRGNRRTSLLATLDAADAYDYFSTNASETILANMSAASIVTCPMTSLSKSVFSLWNRYRDARKGWLLEIKQQIASSPKLRRWKQPLLVTECSSSVWLEGDTTAFKFREILPHKAIRLPPEQQQSLEDLTREVGKVPGAVGYSVLNLRDSIKLPVSADMMFTNIVNKTLRARDNGEHVALDSPRSNVTLCLISAHWKEVDHWSEMSKSADLLSHFTIPIKKILEEIPTGRDKTDLILMQPDWVAGIGSLVNTGPNSSSYEEMARFCSRTEYGPAPWCLSTALALHFIDAIAELTGYGASSGAYNPETDVYIRQKLYAFTYAYEFLSSRGVPLAFVVLLLHALIAFTHLFTILLSKEKWHGSSWGTFGKLLVLALQSKAPKGLVNVGGGVASPQTWTNVAVVRAVGEERQLQIILRAEDVKVEELQELGEGREDGANHAAVEVVKPGVKYS